MNFFLLYSLYSYHHFFDIFENPAKNNINRVDICRKCQNIVYIYGFIFVGHLSNCGSFLDYKKWTHYRVFALSINDWNKEKLGPPADAPYSFRITHYLYFL